VSSFKHLAIIMDGNGTWAKKRHHRRVFGHIRGLKTALRIIKHCSQIQIPFLSLFTLSKENFNRPAEEIELLIKLLDKAFDKYIPFLFQNQIRFCPLGDISVFSKDLREKLIQSQNQTEKHKGLNLILALNYGGRQEIIQAFRKAYVYYFNQSVFPKNIKEKEIASFFPSANFPNPDLLIRTGGESRISNFYLWSLAYTELFFTQTLWPDFTAQELEQILQNFKQRERRFGLI